MPRGNAFTARRSETEALLNSCWARVGVMGTEEKVATEFKPCQISSVHLHCLYYFIIILYIYPCSWQKQTNTSLYGTLLYCASQMLIFFFLQTESLWQSYIKQVTGTIFPTTWFFNEGVHTVFTSTVISILLFIWSNKSLWGILTKGKFWYKCRLMC